MSSRIATLVTGDRVSLTSYSGGRQTAKLLAGSPSVGKPVHTVQAGGHTYVIPQLRPADRGRLDISLFDVTRLLALRRADGSVPVDVTFDKGVAAHDVAGITIDRSTLRRTNAGRSTVTGSWDSAALTTSGSEWASVASVALPSGHPRESKPGYVLHTLTIHVTSRGEPVDFAEAWVMNVDDARLFVFPVLVSDGVGKVSVPEGNYSVMASSFEPWTAIKDDFAVTADTSVRLRAGSATTHPTVTVKGFKAEGSDLTLSRSAARGGSFTMGISGPGFYSRVTPVAEPTHGTLDTFFGATLIPAATRPHAEPTKMAFTKDVRTGVPPRFRVHRVRGDFARLQHRYYATGKEREAFSYVYPFAPQESFAFISGLPATMPSSRPVWLQGSRSLTWFQGLEALFTFSPLRLIEMDAPLAKYSAGPAKDLDFFRGPVGPGLERGVNAGGVSDDCLLCRRGNDLVGGMSFYNAAGTDLVGVTYGKVGNWSLRTGRRTLQRGTDGIFVRQALSAAVRRYHLMATSRPSVRGWTLSPQVTDDWAFSSGAGNRVVPLLMPSYVPTDRLDGTARPGRMGYRVDFENIGPLAARVTRAALWYSVDKGRHWSRAALTRLDKNSFRAHYANPGKGHVSLKLTARDAGDRRITETAIDAYRIRAHAAGRESSSVRPANLAGPAAPTVAVTPAVARDDRQVARALRDRGRAKGATRACPNRGRHYYRCFALIEKVGPRAAAAARAGDPAGWGATDLRDAYGLSSASTSHQTVAVTVAYDYPSAEADLARYRRQFGLPACTSASGCFTKINQNGETTNFPGKDQGWALEAALDLQMISAACPSCKIILAEANQPTTGSLSKTIDAAVAAGAVVTNHSYGISEYGGILGANRHYSPRGVTAVTATGDYGYEPATFPASSPRVVAVGGTVLRHASNPRGWKESAWLYGGSGCSAYFGKPAWQHDRSCGNRTYSDLSAVADSLAVYDTFLPRRYRGWVTVGGTSASSPFVAGLIGAAGAGGIRPAALYGNQAAYHDILKGSNGYCLGNYMCTARKGYDAPTGWGSPKGLAPFGG